MNEANTGHDSFARLLLAEWTKFRTVRDWVIGVTVAAMVTVLFGVLVAAGSRISFGPPVVPGWSAESCFSS